MKQSTFLTINANNDSIQHNLSTKYGFLTKGIDVDPHSIMQGEFTK